MTALRRESRLQDVAAAVSAFDAEAMRRLGIHDMESLVRSVPSLSVVPLSPGEAQLALRGLVKKELQLAVGDPGCFALFFANTGDARTRGAELELTLQPTDSLSFSTQVSYTDAKFAPEEFGAAAGFSEGDRVPNVPRWTYSVAGDYRRQVNGEWDFFSRAVWQHVGESAVELGSVSGDDVPESDIVNAQIGLSSERYEISLFARNLQCGAACSDAAQHDGIDLLATDDGELLHFADRFSDRFGRRAMVPGRAELFLMRRYRFRPPAARTVAAR